MASLQALEVNINLATTATGMNQMKKDSVPLTMTMAKMVMTWII